MEKVEQFVRRASDGAWRVRLGSFGAPKGGRLVGWPSGTESLRSAARVIRPPCVGRHTKRWEGWEEGGGTNGNGRQTFPPSSIRTLLSLSPPFFRESFSSVLSPSLPNSISAAKGNWDGMGWEMLFARLNESIDGRGTETKRRERPKT